MKSLFRKIGEYIKTETPFVVYQEPSAREVRLLAGKIVGLDSANPPEQEGFIFAPFNSDNKRYFLLPERSDFVHSSETSDIKRPEAYPHGDSESDKLAHIELVRKGLEEIRKGPLEKVVLSRAAKASHDLSFIEIFHNLLLLYPEAFCYLWYAPKTGVWAGATPELLAEVSGEKFRTVSLAGTQPFLGDLQPEWGEKEGEEQNMVTRYMQRVLEPYLTQMEVSEAETVRAGDLLHLRTRLQGKLRRNDLFAIVQHLHPTPAVCGLPLDNARDFIRINEGYDREYYTGYLGPYRVFDSDQTSLYVNLRCMQVGKTEAKIYVGGGITADSDPLREWEETCAKAETMRRVLSLKSL